MLWSEHTNGDVQYTLQQTSKEPSHTDKTSCDHPQSKPSNMHSSRDQYTTSVSMNVHSSAVTASHLGEGGKKDAFGVGTQTNKATIWRSHVLTFWRRN